MELDTETQENEKASKKMFFLHSRNSSVSSLVGEEEEDSIELLPSVKDPLPPSKHPLPPSKHKKSQAPDEQENPRRCRLSANGRCMCKLSVVFYLATCVIVSALYVAFFGKNQAFFGDAWIPGKVTNSYRIAAFLACMFTVDL